MTASNWDIYDASKQEKKTEAEIQEIDYLKSIDDIMTEKLKNSKNLFDASNPASHLSIQTSKASGNDGKSGTESSKKLRSQVKSSQSQSKADGEHSESSSSVSKSMNKSQTGPFSTEGTGTAGGGDFANVKAKDIEYVKEELPESMIKAIRIIERLLTQSKYHEQ